MDYLAAIECQLDDRIDVLDVAIQRLDRTKCALRKCLLMPSLGSQGQSSSNEVITNVQPSVQIEVEFDDFNKLDGILNLAKEIRSISSKSTSTKKIVDDDNVSSRETAASNKKTAASRNSKVASRQTLGEALVSKVTVAEHKHVDEPPPLTKERIALNQAVAFRDDMREQLLFLSRYRIPTAVQSYHLNKAKYVEEAKFLSKLSQRTKHPESVSYQVIRSVLSPVTRDTKMEEKNNASNTVPNASGGDSFAAKLALQFQTLIASYERYFKQRLNHETFKVSQLSAEDKRSLLTLWLKGRKLIELYEHYSKAKRKLFCSCEHCVAERKKSLLPRQIVCDELDHAVPMCTPLHPPSVQSDTDVPIPVPKKKIIKGKGKSSSAADLSPVAETVWSYNAKRRVEEYHRAYQSKVMFVVESAVGQDQLRGTVQALKSCCELQSKVAVGSGAGPLIGRAPGEDLRNKWIDALKQFRLVYSILVNEAQHVNHCVFLNK